MTHGWGLIAGVMLYWTNPCYLADGCGPGVKTLTDLDSVRVRYMVRYTTDWRIGFVKSARGHECELDSGAVQTTEQATAVIESKRIGAKVWSCMSNMVGLNEVLDVHDWPSPAPPDTTLYDVAGRVMLKPLPKGLYFTKHGKAVVVR